MRKSTTKQDVATGAGALSVDQFKMFQEPRAAMKSIFNDLMSINPQYFETPIAEIISHAEEKHWYELGQCLVELFSADVTIGEREPIYSKFILNFAKLLNPKHLTNIIILVSKDFSSPEKSLEFIKNNSKYIESKKYSPLLSLREVVLMTQNGLFEDSLKLLSEISKEITELSPLPIKSEYWKTKCELDRSRGDFDSFYEDAFYYLSTTNSKSYSLFLAFDLCISALIAKDVYSFQELASHPILDVLTNSKNKWIRDLILLLNEGNPSIIDEFEEKYVSLIKTNRYLSQNLELLKTKVIICVFMTLIFNKPFDNRILTFDEICEECKIDKKQVELIALKAFANDLIKGYIDEVENVIVITWCKPRGLSLERIKHLKEEIDRWCSIVANLEAKESSKARGVLL